MDPPMFESISEPSFCAFWLNFLTLWLTVFFDLEEGLKIGSVQTPVLTGVGLVEGVGTRGEVVDPPEEARSAGAAGDAGAGLGLLWKVYSSVRYSGMSRGFPVSRRFRSCELSEVQKSHSSGVKGSKPSLLLSSNKLGQCRMWIKLISRSSAWLLIELIIRSSAC